MRQHSKNARDMTRTLTPRQVEILTLIRDTRRRHGYSPTLQEMADELGVSKITIFEHVASLAAKGMVVRHSYRARSLELTSSVRLPDERPSLLPLVGRIAAGKPIETFETPDTVDLETLYSSRHPVRVLKVHGDSMIEEHIRDGDFVVYEDRSNARNGDTVVALLPDNETTLKKFYKEKGRFRLQPANPRFKPVYTKELEIQGVVIGVVRRM